MNLTWVEISKSALTHNIKTFRKIVGKGVLLAPTVKANAYGHGLVECSKAFLDAGAEYLCVNALYEAEALRNAGIKSPILIIGYTALSELENAAKLKLDMTVYNEETLQALGEMGKYVKVHLKIETGNHRQGVKLADLPKLIPLFRKYKNVKLTGVSTHFADIEDNLNQKYALHQLELFKKAIAMLEDEGFSPEYRHCANTAATLILPEAHFNFVRIGIGAYGLWPSEKTLKAAENADMKIELKPALSWKTVVVQVKNVEVGNLIGYGSTYEVKKKGKIAVLPVGYYDGFVRSLSNKGAVMIKGKPAPVVGRVCMNMIMVDVSHIPNVKLEDEVILIGEGMTAEHMAELSDTINYEVTTRINERIPRIIV